MDQKKRTKVRYNSKHRQLQTITIIAAVSIDGYISDNPAKMPRWTSREDWREFQSELSSCDAVVMGRNTFAAAYTFARKRTALVFSTKKSVPLGTEVYIDPSVDSVRRQLAPYRNIAILGGTSVYNYFLKRDMVSRLLITIEPVCLGGTVPLCTNGVRKRMRLVRSRVLNKRGTLLLEYKPL